VTPGVTAQRATRPERSTAFNPLTSLGLGEGEGVRNSRLFTRFSEAFGPTLVQDRCSRRKQVPKATAVQFLTVSEAAARLRVSPSTVYSLCTKGKLPYMRVSNALRIPSEDVDALARRSNRGRP
jgi:excisionase family DNA binding protein